MKSFWPASLRKWLCMSRASFEVFCDVGHGIGALVVVVVGINRDVRAVEVGQFPPLHCLPEAVDVAESGGSASAAEKQNTASIAAEYIVVGAKREKNPEHTFEFVTRTYTPTILRVTRTQTQISNASPTETIDSPFHCVEIEVGKSAARLRLVRSTTSDSLRRQHEQLAPSTRDLMQETKLKRKWKVSQQNSISTFRTTLY